MKKVILAGLLALTLGGCSTGLTTVENVWNSATSGTVSVTAVSVAGNSYDALQATATNYLHVCNTTPSAIPTCKNVSANKQLIRAVRAGRIARANLEQFYKDHPGQLGPKGLYDALQAATNTLQTVITTYKIGA